MEKQRVNKVTAVFNEEGGVTMTLYRTHKKLAQLSNTDIKVPSFEESGATNKATYMIYCKETLITLLQNDGVEGYYYEEKSEDATEIPKKFTEPLFIQWSKNVVDELIAKMNIDVQIETTTANTMPEITERYKNGNIKYGTMKVTAVMGEIKFQVPVAIKSGQLSKPKKIEVDGQEKGFNVTTLKTLMKNGGITPQKIVKEKPEEPIEEPQGTDMPANITELKEDIKEVKEDVSELKEDMAEVKEDTKAVKKEVRNIKRKTERKTTRKTTNDNSTSANISKLMRAMKNIDAKQ